MNVDTHDYAFKYTLLTWSNLYPESTNLVVFV